jgi:hypothetical protein
MRVTVKLRLERTRRAGHQGMRWAHRAPLSRRTAAAGWEVLVPCVYPGDGGAPRAGRACAGEIHGTQTEQLELHAETAAAGLKGRTLTGEQDISGASEWHHDD